MSVSETKAELRAQIAALREQLRNLRRPPAEWHSAALELLRNGMSRHDVSIRLELSYESILQFTSKHRRDTGEAFPYRRKDGGWNGVFSQRHLDIVAAYREIGTLEATGASFGLTRERVRQIVVKYERITGETIKRYKPINGPRIPLSCPGCGRTRNIPPSIAEKASPYCFRCGHRKRVDVERVGAIIALRRTPLNWRQTGLRAGFNKQATWTAERMVYSHLTYHGRHGEIAELWPKGVPNWLRKHDRSIKTAA